MPHQNIYMFESDRPQRELNIIAEKVYNHLKKTKKAAFSQVQVTATPDTPPNAKLIIRYEKSALTYNLLDRSAIQEALEDVLKEYDPALYAEGLEC